MKQRTVARQIVANQSAQARMFGAGCARLPFYMRLRVAMLIACKGNPHAEILCTVGLATLALLAVAGVVATGLLIGRIV